MKILLAALSAVTILFALLGILNILPFTVTSPIMFLSLATLFAVRAYDCRKKSDMSGALLYGGMALFLYVVTFYNIFSIVTST